MATILIVDDSATLRASVTFSLSQSGYEVVEAADGPAALEILGALAGEGRRIDMIITDVNMPGMDGISLVGEIKKTDFRFVPILILTTESQTTRIESGRAAGASGWLVKPFKPDQLIEVVEKLLP